MPDAPELTLLEKALLALVALGVLASFVLCDFALWRLVHPTAPARTFFFD